MKHYFIHVGGARSVNLHYVKEFRVVQRGSGRGDSSWQVEVTVDKTTYNLNGTEAHDALQVFLAATEKTE